MAKDHCPICGVDYNTSFQHRCNPRVLRGIDGAHTAANNREMYPERYKSRTRTYDERLNEGLRMLAEKDFQVD